RIEAPELHLRIVLRQCLRDRRRQRRLAVIDVTNRAYVAVRLATIKFFLRHTIPSERLSSNEDSHRALYEPLSPRRGRSIRILFGCDQLPRFVGTRPPPISGVVLPR